VAFGQTVGVAFPEDPGVLSVLRTFSVTADDLLGHGGEAWVFSLGADRVLRVLQPGGRVEDIDRRRHLVAELSRAGPPFALPDVLEVGEEDGRAFAVERRLPGRSVLEELKSSSGPARKHLVEHSLEAAAALGDLSLEPRRTYGDLIMEGAITTSTWGAYLAERAAANLARSTSDFWSIDPEALADALPEPTGPSFVHLDAFAGNMLTDGTGITAVLYLVSSDITGVVRASDIDVAMSWLRAAGLHDWYEPARRWLAAYWSVAVDDRDLLRWCHRVLLDDG
jgi:hypothetical protein